MQGDQEGGNEWAYSDFHRYVVCASNFTIVLTLCRYFLKYEKYTPDKRFPLVDPKLRGSNGPLQS